MIAYPAHYFEPPELDAKEEALGELCQAVAQIVNDFEDQNGVTVSLGVSRQHEQGLLSPLMIECDVWADDNEEEERE